MSAGKLDAVRLAVFKHLFAAVAEEMGVVLGRSSFSPNIKERRDYSCGVFDGRGRLAAQAAHIPVHLGSMPMSVDAALADLELGPGDVAILNDPFRGGTHLPDVTMVSAVWIDGRPLFHLANRAHHADVGGGYETKPPKRLLSDIPLAWMAGQAGGAGLEFESHLVVKAHLVDEARLIFAGTGTAIVDGWRDLGVAIDPHTRLSETDLSSPEATVAELVISQKATFLDRTLEEIIQDYKDEIKELKEQLRNEYLSS